VDLRAVEHRCVLVSAAPRAHGAALPENATLDRRGVLTLDSPPKGTHQAPPLPWQRYPHVDGYIHPWTSAGKLRPGLRFKGAQRGRCFLGAETARSALSCLAGNSRYDACFPRRRPWQRGEQAACSWGPGSRTFTRWLITLGSDPPIFVPWSRIGDISLGGYKDEVEAEYGSSPATATGCTEAEWTLRSTVAGSARFSSRLLTTGRRTASVSAAESPSGRVTGRWGIPASTSGTASCGICAFGRSHAAAGSRSAADRAPCPRPLTTSSSRGSSSTFTAAGSEASTSRSGSSTEARRRRIYSGATHSTCGTSSHNAARAVVRADALRSTAAQRVQATAVPAARAKPLLLRLIVLDLPAEPDRPAAQLRDRRRKVVVALAPLPQCSGSLTLSPQREGGQHARSCREGHRSSRSGGTRRPRQELRFL
jgi:hypothetical protein